MKYIAKILTLTVGAASFVMSGCASNGEPPIDTAFSPTPAAPYYAEYDPNTQSQLRPAISTGNPQETSLWSSSPKSLFGDRRASQVGDLLTVLVEIEDEAEIKNSETNSRQTSDNFGVGAFFGLPEVINRNLPDGASLTPAVDITRDRNTNGDGMIKREETITLRLAVQVVDVKPNGYLQLAGQQQIMVNSEVRQLQVSGLIRTEDISRQNIITYDKIADARIYYGGRGNVTDTVKPRAGNKLLQKIIPF